MSVFGSFRSNFTLKAINLRGNLISNNFPVDVFAPLILLHAQPSERRCVCFLTFGERRRVNTLVHLPGLAQTPRSLLPAERLMF